ncbi:MAG: hypothetical protein GXY53_08845, partial [Desulfobulbus sp.]|nr:hypothetical protein [Desulfobulbus sp.]
MLALSDFYILSSFIESEAERFLPFPATIYFAGPDTDGSLQPLQAGAINKNKVQSYEPSSPVLNPYMSEDKIVIPLTLPSKEHVALILTDVDPEILKKMSPRWLQNTGEDLLSA